MILIDLTWNHADGNREGLELDFFQETGVVLCECDDWVRNAVT